MTDKQIIKALECCVIGYECPKDCPYMGKGLCVDKIRKDALDLINRQKAEIERLNRDYSTAVETMSNSIRTSRTEAVKEFAERLKEIGARNAAGLILFVEKDLDNLVNEMVGEG